MPLSIFQGSFSAWGSHKTNPVEQRILSAGFIQMRMGFLTIFSKLTHFLSQSCLKTLPGHDLFFKWCSQRTLTAVFVCVSYVEWMSTTVLPSNLKWPIKYSWCHRLSHIMSLYSNSSNDFPYYSQKKLRSFSKWSSRISSSLPHPKLAFLFPEHTKHTLTSGLLHLLFLLLLHSFHNYPHGNYPQFLQVYP